MNGVQSHSAAPKAWLFGPDGAQHELSGDSVTCGRAAGNDVVVDDQHVSRRHARFEASTMGYAVVDLGSANGTWVNGESLPHGILLLADGDQVSIGSYTFTYRWTTDLETPIPVLAPHFESAGSSTQRLFAAVPEIVQAGAAAYARIRVQGIINIESTEWLLQTASWAIEQGTTVLLIDATQVERIDSAGIGGLVRLQRQLTVFDGRLGIVGPPTMFRVVVELLNLSTLIRMYADEIEALSALNTGLA